MCSSSYLRLILLALASVVFSSGAFAEQKIFNEDQELLMAVEFSDGVHVADSISTFHVDNVWYLPIGELADGLAIDVKVSPALKKAEGFLIDEKNRISLDLEKCEFEVDGKIQKFECASAVVYNDEIYLSSSVLSSWWHLKFEFLQNQSLIVLRSDLKFPAQLKLERERKTVANSKSSEKITYDLEKNPSKNFLGPSIDQQLAVKAQKQNGKMATNLTHDTLASAELFGFESSGYVGGVDSDVSQWSLTFSKKDADGGLPLGARDYSLIDVLAPSVPLVANNARVRGALVSSYPLINPDSFSFRDFTGILPSGWEVELYQNDTLIGRQSAGDSTQYNFKNIPLYYGLNRFKFIFYGPQGQRQEEVELVNIDPSMALPKQRSYRIVAGEDVLDSESRTLAQYTHSLSNSSSITATYFNGVPDDGEKHINYGQLNFISKLGRNLIGLNATGNDQNGSAYEASIQTPFENASLGLRHAVFDKFQSEAFNKTLVDPITQVSRANLGITVPYFSSLRLTAEAVRKYFEDRHEEWTGAQRTSVQFQSLILSHSINYDDTVEGKWIGEFSSIYLFGKNEFRFTSDYQKSIRNISSFFQMPIDRTATVGLRGQRDYLTSVNEGALTLNKNLKNCIVGSEVTISSNGDFSIQGLLSYGSIFDPVKKHQAFYQRGQTNYGAAGVTVFLDLNQNQMRDEGEPGLENIRVLVNQQDAEELTSKDGYVLLSHLPVHQPVNLSISLKSIPDPSYRPILPGKSIVLRPGGAAQIELPVGVFGEVSGIVNIKTSASQTGKRGIVVELVNSTGKVVAHSRTGSDGYYVMEEIPPGSYTVRVKDDQLSELSLQPQPSSYQFVIDPKDLTDRSYDFVLSRIENVTKKH